MKKIALITALVIGTAGAAFAEDSSSSFDFNIYTQAAQGQHHVLTNRNVSLGGQTVIERTQAGPDRASAPYAGGGF
jgi:hypothetical protein